ncbi:MAG: M23 family metallopeptidase [Bacteroidales bacterium]|nr:M23 family metallopeptidase [Bacteroidales bacterium]
MRKTRLISLLGLMIVPVFLAMSQKQYPKDYFRSPVGFPITLSGSFGEIRRNHFHSGIDIRTGGVEGKPVYAIADGYVSRVNVSPSGFGKALYINHPNGYTSLYGHLRNYAGGIGSWVKTQQYKKESFAMDTEVPEGTLKVKKGDLIAYSGNSGSSGGPHLHFEIRDTKSQEIIDPLDFGLMKSDGIPPIITHVKIFPIGENSMVNFADKAVLFPVTGSGSNFRLRCADTVKVSGNIIFGIETSDHAEGGLKTGVHVIDLAVDGVKVFSQNIDRFAFSETRYVNSLMDYPAYVQSKHKIQRSHVAPNNKLSVYSDVKNRGVLNFMDSKAHQVRYVVKDAFGNSAMLLFYVKSHPPANMGEKPKATDNQGTQLFSYKTDNHFERTNLKFSVPSEAVYDDFPFEYSVTPSLHGSCSNVHRLQNQDTPLHTWCSLSIKPERLPEKLESKALIVSLDQRNRFASKGGKFENGWITAKIRDFGNYTVAVDTVSPAIKAVNIFPGKTVTKQSTIQVKISDNLAGINTYRGTLNGKWILMDYDGKNSLLTYVFDEMIKSGKNIFVLVVTDAVGNSSRYEATLLR